MREAKDMMYVVNKELKNVPSWLNDYSKNGKVKLIKEQDELVGLKVMSGTKIYDAYIGDIILLTKTGLIVKKKGTKNEETE